MPVFNYRLMKQFLLKLSVIALLFACNPRGKEADGSGAIARAYHYYLYPEDIASIVPRGSTEADSALIVKSFIDDWMRRKAVLAEAERTLSAEEKDVSSRLEEYRNSLITHAFETEIVRVKLDTTISEEEINSFYQEHLKNFQLKDNIIRVKYLKLSKNSPKLDKVKGWLKSDNEKDRKSLEEYCHQYALNYYLDDSTWLLFDDLLKEIPIKTYDKEQFLKNNRNVEIEDSTLLYLVNIKGFMVRNSVSPLSFERKNIIALIMNERKLKLLDEMESKAYENGLRKGDVEYLVQ